MKEHGVIRRRVSGPEAAPYMNVARNLLGYVKQQIQYGGLSQLTKTVDLPNGVRITAMSIFGQDEVRISVPGSAQESAAVHPRRNKSSAQSEVIFGNHSSAFRWTKDAGMEVLSDAKNLKIFGVSANGKTLVGNDSATYPVGAVYWTKKSGQVDLGVNVGGVYPIASGASEDGSIIVGYSNSGSFRWTKNTGAILIGSGSAEDISADGAVIVGNDNSDNAYIWTESAKTTVIGAFLVTAISADGTTVVGLAPVGNSYFAVRWTKKTGMVFLPVIMGAKYTSAHDVSEDGSVVVGTMDFDDAGGYPHKQPFRWTEKTGMVNIGVLPVSEPTNTNDTRAQSVSPDGKIVVGQGIGQSLINPNTTNYQTFRWTEETGMISLGDMSGSSGGRSVIATPTTYFVDDIEVDKKTYDATPNY